MGTLTITRSYNDTALLSETDLDNIKDGTQTFLNTTKLNGDNIQDDGIDAGLKLILGSLEAAKFPANAITSTKLADSPDGITAIKINNLAVTTAKIAASAVTTAKITDASVTYAKLSACNTDVSVASGSIVTLAAYTTISDSNFLTQGTFTKSITTTGRPVLIQLIGEDATSNVTATSSGAEIVIGYFAIFRDGTLISATSNTKFSTSLYGNALPSICIDQPSAGAHEYTFRCYCYSVSAARYHYTNLKMRVTEL